MEREGVIGAGNVGELEVAAAWLDVTVPEPLSKGRPFCSHNTIVTPSSRGSYRAATRDYPAPHRRASTIKLSPTSMGRVGGSSRLVALRL